MFSIGPYDWTDFKCNGRFMYSFNYYLRHYLYYVSTLPASGRGINICAIWFLPLLPANSEKTRQGKKKIGLTESHVWSVVPRIKQEELKERGGCCDPERGSWLRYKQKEMQVEPGGLGKGCVCILGGYIWMEGEYNYVLYFCDPMDCSPLGSFVNGIF